MSPIEPEPSGSTPTKCTAGHLRSPTRATSERSSDCPIINQPQVAILGVGTIEKRPVVIDDMIGIRLMGYLTLGYDHRLVDGAVADQFMADVKKGIETFDGAQV